jgi:hypothetical protein
MDPLNKRKWLGRILIGFVLVMNLQCSLLFLFRPDRYASGFELVGETGKAYVRGIGLLFLMWNVPYFVAVLDPIKNQTSLFEAIVMQSIGLVGETILVLALTGGHPLLVNTMTRFIIFDSLGLVSLLASAWITRDHRAACKSKE